MCHLTTNMCIDHEADYSTIHARPVEEHETQRTTVHHVPIYTTRIWVITAGTHSRNWQQLIVLCYRCRCIICHHGGVGNTATCLTRTMTSHRIHVACLIMVELLPTRKPWTRRWSRESRRRPISGRVGRVGCEKHVMCAQSCTLLPRRRGVCLRCLRISVCVSHHIHVSL